MGRVAWLASLGLCSGVFIYLSACTDPPMQVGDGADGGSQDGEDNLEGGPATDLAATITSPTDFLTGAPGIAADFTGVASCPAEEQPCTVHWDLSNGQTSDKASLGRVTFAEAGYYTGTFTVRGKSGATVRAEVHVSAWTKSFGDDFNRAGLDAPAHGWRIPTLDQLNPDAGPGTSELYSIDANWLHITGDTQAPGSSAFLAYPMVQNGRGTFRQKRQPQPLSGTHYTDLVLRYNPAKRDGQFYRVRTHELFEQGGLARGDCVELAIFRITKDDDQHGHLLNNHLPYWQNPALDGGVPPTGSGSADVVGFEHEPGPLAPSVDEQCLDSNGNPSGDAAYPPSDPGCVTTVIPAAVDRFRIEVTAQGNVVTFKLFGYQEGVGIESLLLADKITDTDPAAVTGAGIWGMAHFDGNSYMDDFKLESLDP